MGVATIPILVMAAISVFQFPPSRQYMSDRYLSQGSRKHLPQSLPSAEILADLTEILYQRK